VCCVQWGGAGQRVVGWRRNHHIMGGSHGHHLHGGTPMLFTHRDLKSGNGEWGAPVGALCGGEGQGVVGEHPGVLPLWWDPHPLIHHDLKSSNSEFVGWGEAPIGAVCSGEGQGSVW